MKYLIRIDINVNTYTGRQILQSIARPLQEKLSCTICMIKLKKFETLPYGSILTMRKNDRINEQIIDLKIEYYKQEVTNSRVGLKTICCTLHSTYPNVKIDEVVSFLEKEDFNVAKS